MIYNVNNNDNWYRTVYQRLIIRAKSRGYDKSKLGYYTEKHHIVPKCAGGQDEVSNLCLLTYKEHVIAHKILCRLHPEIGGLFVAASFMLSSRNNLDDKNINVSQKDISFYKERAIKHLTEINRGENNPAFGTHISKSHKEAISKANKGKKKSILTRMKMSKSQTGKKASEETKEKLSKSHSGLKIHSQERKSYLAERWRGENNPSRNRDLSGGNNPSSIKIIDKNGLIYGSIKECAIKNNVSYEKMRDWVKNKPEKGFKPLI